MQFVLTRIGQKKAGMQCKKVDSHHKLSQKCAQNALWGHTTQKSYYFRRGNIADDTVVCYSWTEDAQIADDPSGQRVARTLSLALLIVRAIFQN